ncbi:MICOS complex subunit MIC10-like isoform X1 [Ananas comosus]|uniref:MICOS complex subunit MIC10-like isoform X1 n=1 Tax=Ananas comosus TaxID=4615 RepID=A0A199VV32_ANACO|nr:MICOS complex subunit MIC10-like isoform X1 [Ananas comosus]OAY81097.1 hypothetical protein ACMD2_18333 [Ananas comosus]
MAEEENKTTPPPTTPPLPTTTTTTTTTKTIPARYDLDAKWDACLDLSIRRVVYSSLAGAFTGLLFFRSPTTRWASIAFGAGAGVGAAYTECSYLFDGSAPKWSPPPKVSTVHPASSLEEK